MGIYKAFRGKGGGSWLANLLVTEAKSRGDAILFLEVIAQNLPAIHVYEKLGFVQIRRLVGFKVEQPAVSSQPNDDYPLLESCKVEDIVSLIKNEGIETLPWQIDEVTLPRTGSFAFRRDDAFVAISDPTSPSNVIIINSVIVKKDERGKGKGRSILETLFRAYPGKTWKVPARFPEEVAGFFEKLGFQREAISQYQMQFLLR